MAKTTLSEALKAIQQDKILNLIPQNLKAGIKALGVTGAFTNDASATKETIVRGNTAYVKGDMVTGEAHRSSTNIRTGRTIEEVSNITIEKPSGVTYGFNLDSDGYYTSSNKANSSFSLGILRFSVNIPTTLKLSCISYGENNYDYGILSELDKTLNANTSADTTNVKKNFKGLSSSSPREITYENVTMGEHFIYLKYIKDSSGSSGTDNFRVKITNSGTVDETVKVTTIPFNTVEEMQNYEYTEENLAGILYNQDLEVSEIYINNGTEWQKQALGEMPTEDYNDALSKVNEILGV